MLKQSLLVVVLATISSVSLAASLEREEAVIRGVNYIGISVSDLDAATSFYREAADLSVVHENELESAVLAALSTNPDHTVQTRLLKSVNAQIRLMEFPQQAQSGHSPVAVNGPGIAHVCYQVADETLTYQRFINLGATPIGAEDPVQLNARNPVVYAYAHDADGIMFEVEEIDFSQISRPRKNDYRIRHVSLASPDMESIVAFYSILMEEPEPRRSGIGGTLGGEAFDQVSGLPGTRMEMAWFQVRNLELEIVQYHSHPPGSPDADRPISAPGYNLMMFDVADLQAADELVRMAGGEVITDILSMDGGEAFFARDPDGNLLGFQRLPEDNPYSSRNFADNGT